MASLLSSLLLVALLATFTLAAPPKNDLTPLMNVVIIRHGDRTPLTRFPTDNTVWNCSSLPAEISQSPIQPTLPLASSNLRYAKYFTRSVLPGNCMMGQLTDIGIKQHIELGQRLGRRIGKNVDCSNIKLETTDRPRTIQSMESLMTGFLGVQSQCVSPNYIFTVATQETKVGDMHANFDACPWLPQQLIKFSEDEEWQKEHAKYTDVFDRVIKAFELSPESNVELWQIADVLTCRASRGIAPPAGLSQEDVDAINDIYVWEYAYTNKMQKYVQLSIGAFLRRALEDMELSTRTNNTGTAFRLYSGHDTTLAPLLGALGIELNMDTWPVYASNIVFQLATDGSQRYITVEYMEKPIQVRGCSDIACPWEEFKASVAPYLISHEDWVSQCSHDVHNGRVHLKDRTKQ